MATCTKIPYATYPLAQHVLRKIRARSEPSRAPVAIHWCHGCTGWHLTSKRPTGNPWWVRKFGEALKM